MKKDENFLENFKTAIISTVKSLSETENVDVSFGQKKFDKNKLVVNLPELENINNKLSNIGINFSFCVSSLYLRCLYRN